MKLSNIAMTAFALPSLTSALITDFVGLGRLIAKNASYTPYPAPMAKAGCVTDEFLWTLNTNKCGIFYGYRHKFDRHVRQTQYVFKSRNGLCGLGSKKKVVCGRWVGEGLGPLNGTDNGKGVFDLNVALDAPKVLEEGNWLAIDNTDFADGTNDLRFREGVDNIYFLMWWTDRLPTDERDVTIWNNVDDEHPLENVTLDHYDIGARLVWNTMEVN